MLQQKANYIRQELIRVAVKNNKGHIAPSLSTVEILTALYYEVMKPEDRFILSKGHGCYALYAILADKGLIPKDVWENFQLDGCVSRNTEYGLLASTGSLGQGLSIACGMAWAKKLKNEKGKVYCLIGDGEMEEGQVWEALRFSVEKELDNLIIIIDNNRLRALDSCYYNDWINLQSLLLPMTYILYKIDGHSIKYIKESLLSENNTKRPKIIIAKTTKGKGIKCAEDVPMFHYRIPTEAEINELP